MSAVAFDPWDYAIHEDPYPTYARLRAEEPVYRNEKLDFWALSRHADVLAAFRDSERFSNRYGVSLDKVAWGEHAHKSMSFLAMDPPRHTRIRALVSKGFTPRRVAELEGTVRAMAAELVETALEAREFDLVEQIAGRLPMDVISEMIGVPAEDRQELRRLADLLVHRLEGIEDVPPEGLEAALLMVGYFSELIVGRRRSPGEDLTSALLAIEDEGDKLSDEELISFLFLMVVAGNETTTKMIANAWYWADRFPDEKAKALASPERASDWVEETVRFDNSTQLLARLAAADVMVRDRLIHEGDRVLLLIGSANRDADVFADADAYDLDRDIGTRTASFGTGRHFCMGASLARLEGRVVLEELQRRVADYEVDEGGAVRVHSVNVRGFARLPTRVRVR
jgi:cytochrome P450